MRVRADLRNRWPTLLTVGVVLGCVAGALLAAASAARRTDSAFDRLAASTDAPDLFVAESLISDPETDKPRSADALGVDAVVRVVLINGIFTVADGRELRNELGFGAETGVIASLDPRWGDTMQRLVIVEGRAADPSSPTEVVATRDLADGFGVRVGDRILVTIGAQPDDPPRPNDLEVEVVGIAVEALGARPESGFYLRSFFATSAFVGVLSPSVVEQSRYAGLTFRPGTSPDLFATNDSDFLTDVIDFAWSRADQRTAIADGTRTDVTMLWLVVALGGLGAVLVLAPVVVRLAQGLQDDSDRLMILGWTRADVRRRSLFHGSIIGIGAMICAGIVSLVLSSLGPIGDARHFEPNPGVRFDTVVCSLGAGLLLVFVLVGFVGAASIRSDTNRLTTAALSDRLSVAPHVGPVAGLGLRMAFQQRSLRHRTSGYTVAVGLAFGAVVASVTFLAQLRTLVSDPELVGVDFDLMLLNESPSGTDELAATLLAQPEVARSTAGTYFPLADGRLGEEQLFTWTVSYRAGAGQITPVVVAGRAPIAPHELLVHPALLDELGAGIGDIVPLSAFVDDDGVQRTPPIQVAQQFEIVGTGVVVIGGFQFKTASAVTFEGLANLFGDARPDGLPLRTNTVVVQFVEGVDRQAVVERWVQDGLVREEDLFPRVSSVAEDFVGLNLGEVHSIPIGFALLTAGLAAAVVVVSAVERRRSWRRDIAIYRALGMTNRGVRGAAVSAAVMSTLLAALLAAPLGILAGRYLWLRYAKDLGVVPRHDVPWLDLAAITAAAGVVAALVTLVPACLSPRRPSTVDIHAE